MRVTVQNVSTKPVSTDVGLLLPGESKTQEMSPQAAYLAAANMKTLKDRGFVTVSVAEEPSKLDDLEPAAVATASVADGAVTTAKLAAGAVTTAKVTALNIDSTLLAAGAVTAGKIAAGGISAANQHAAGVVDTAALAATAVTKAKALVFRSTEQTGTGSSQNIAHGLGATPTVVTWSFTDAPAGAFTLAEGSHTSTNVVVTATSGLKFVVFAWA